MTEILLVRHGQTDWNVERRIMGHSPIPLNKVGRAQAKAMSKALKKVKVDYAYSSPMKRARETTQILMKDRRVRIEPHMGLAEIDYGDWVGRTFDEVVHEKAFQVYHRYPSQVVIPDGENLKDVLKRVVALVEMVRKKHKGKRVLFVSHADVIKAILVHYLGLTLDDILRLRIDNVSLSILHLGEKRDRVLAVNCMTPPENLFIVPTDQMVKKL